MTHFISLGSKCHIKTIMKKCGYAKEADIFDWCFSATLLNVINILDNQFNIFDDMVEYKSSLNAIILYNKQYSLLLRHESEYFKLNNHSLFEPMPFDKKSPGAIEIIKKYERRYGRFINYKYDTFNNYVFMRIINTIPNNEGFPKEIISENYNKETYDKLQKHLPKNNIVMLISHKQLSEKEKKEIYEKFIVLDNTILAQFACSLPNNVNNPDEFVKVIIEQYRKFFEYIHVNYNLIKSDLLTHQAILKDILNPSILDKYYNKNTIEDIAVLPCTPVILEKSIEKIDIVKEKDFEIITNDTVINDTVINDTVINDTVINDTVINDINVNNITTNDIISKNKSVIPITLTPSIKLSVPTYKKLYKIKRKIPKTLDLNLTLNLTLNISHNTN